MFLHFLKTSELFQRHPNASKCIRMRPNRSEWVRTSISKLPKMHSAASGHVRSSEDLGRVFSLEDASLVLTFEFSETPEALRARFFLRPGHFFARTRCLFDRTGCFFARTGCFFFRTGHFFVQGERTESSPCVPTSPPSLQKFLKIFQVFGRFCKLCLVLGLAETCLDMFRYDV